MARINELQKAALDEAIKQGAVLTFDHSAKHIVGILIFNNKQRKMFIKQNETNMHLRYIVRNDVRRLIREMSS